MHQDGPPRQEQPPRPQYPTPQTNAIPVVKSSSRFWSYLYNDPRRRLLLISALIGTAYLIFRTIDAVLLYNSIYDLLAPLSTSTEAVLRESVWSIFRIEIPTVHYLALAVAVVFNWIAWRVRRPWVALLCCLLYLVSAVSYIRWAVFVLPEILLTVLGYMATVRKANRWL